MRCLTFACTEMSSSKDAAESGRSLPLCACLCIRRNKEASSACHTPHLVSILQKYIMLMPAHCRYCADISTKKKHSMQWLGGGKGSLEAANFCEYRIAYSHCRYAYMQACMFIRLYACMYICMYVSIYVYIYISTNLCIILPISLSLYLRMGVGACAPTGPLPHGSSATWTADSALTLAACQPSVALRVRPSTR